MFSLIHNKICGIGWLVFNFLFFLTDAVSQSKLVPLVGFISNLALFFFLSKGCL